MQKQQDALPAQFDAQQQGLQAQANQAHQDILSQAQNRGLGFSGIPVGEQAKYDATSFMPAVANLKSNQINAQTNLSDQLNKINLDQRTQASGILSQQQAQDEQRRQFDANMAFQREQADRAAKAAAAQSAALSSFGSGGASATAPANNAPTGIPKMSKSSGGFNFTDAYGTPITAADYVQLYNNAGGKLGYRDLLSQMASAGDANAKVALNYVGNDAKFGSAPQQYAAALHALGATGNFAQPQQTAQQNGWKNASIATSPFNMGIKMGGGR